MFETLQAKPASGPLAYPTFESLYGSKPYASIRVHTVRKQKRAAFSFKALSFMALCLFAVTLAIQQRQKLADAFPRLAPIYSRLGLPVNVLGLEIRNVKAQVLTAGASAPQYVAQSTLSVGSATTATNLAGGAANRIAYQTGAGATGFITAPSVSSTYLQWNGPAFVWSSAGTGTVTSVDVSGGTTGLTTSGGPVTTSGTITLSGTLVASNGGTGQASYAVGDILYASTTSALSKLTIGTNGYVLTSSGTAPQYVAQSTLSVGSATSATNATNIAVTSNSANAPNYLTFVSATTGNLPQLVNSSITCNPSTGAITGGVSGGTF